ncbi:hypothetical protein ACGFZR_15375 [Streptomyces sp. NPDC048241]|uniref:hypothetical protein n=1 Tax=Streptomyces sp. NPDC048241 TaxID=3365521 RepID=UPI003717EE99
MTTSTETAFTPTATDMEATHYGIPVCTYGEDGNMLALGHHDKRQAFAAFNRHARVFLGFANFADDRNAHLADWIDEIHKTWAVFHRCAGDSDWTWEARPAAPDTPGAVPITVLDVA